MFFDTLFWIVASDMACLLSSSRILIYFSPWFPTKTLIETNDAQMLEKNNVFVFFFIFHCFFLNCHSKNLRHTLRKGSEGMKTIWFFYNAQPNIYFLQPNGMKCEWETFEDFFSSPWFLVISDFLLSFFSLTQATSARNFTEDSLLVCYFLLLSFSLSPSLDCVCVTVPLLGSLSFLPHPSDVVLTQKIFLEWKSRVAFRVC